MASLWVDLRDIKFQLFEVLKIEETLLGKGRYKDFDADTCIMALDAAAKFAENDIAPTYPDEVHRKPVEATFDKGKVTRPKRIRNYGNFIAKTATWLWLISRSRRTGIPRRYRAAPQICFWPAIRHL